MQQLPYGISSFKRLQEGNLYYVDKTRFIETIENCTDYLAIFRPRRIGKSLFLSTLECYYDYKYAEKFFSLFKGTWIGDHPTKERNSYTALSLDFSGLSADTPEELKDALSSKLITKFNAFLAENNLRLSNPLLKTEFPAQIADSFFSQIASIIKYPIYLLIDEYDDLANEIFASANSLKTVLLSSDIFRNFFAVIKEHTKSNTIQKIFLTGVTPLLLNNFTSGYNITLDITLNPVFYDIMGFTNDEVKGLATSLSYLDLDIDEIINKMLSLYNGYRFSLLSDQSVLNSCSVLYYLVAYSITNHPPTTLLDPNVLVDFSQIQALASIPIASLSYGRLNELDESIKQRQAILKSIAADNSRTANLTQVFSLDNFSDYDFLSVLFYMGYLTISDYRKPFATLDIPNRVIKDIWTRK